MPQIRASKAYKKQRHKEIQKKYCLKWKDAVNKRQRLLMRSRRAKFQHGLDDNELRLHRRRNQEAVERHRKLSPLPNNSVKDKLQRNLWLKYQKQYEYQIRQYYSHVCNCCGRLMRESRLKLLDRKQIIGSKIFLDSVFWIQKTNISKFCRNCSSYIEKIKVPPLASSNGLDFPKVHEKISKLNRVEERLLAPRHVFQTIWTVQGPNGQYKTKGGIVNVPIDMDTSVKSLPRNVDDSHMIHVRIARKMEYVRDYMSGIVRPKLLYDAAKAFVSKPLLREEQIQLNENWMFQNDCNDDMFPSDDEQFVRNAIYETMLTTDNLASAFNGLLDDGLRIAPAQDYVPKSILFDDNCEYLAFPTVFGGYKMNPQHEGKSLSYAQLIKSMIMRYDRRVAKRGDLLLFLAKKLELIKLYNNINICLRKKTSTNPHVTAGQMLNPTFVQGLLQHNDGYKVLNGIRSSPAHWQKEKTKLMGQIRQFGLPTFFITLSSADTHWPELIVALKKSVDNEVISEEQAMQLSSVEKAKLVQKDPITCALHFDQRFKALKKTWECPDGPFFDHKILHYYYRIEFQQRG